MRHPDTAIVQRLLDGDEQAFSELITRHHPMLMRVAMGYVSGRSVAEEVVQETWLAVLRGLPAFQGRSQLKTWIVRILINRAKTRAKREGRTIPQSALGPADRDVPALDPSLFRDDGHWSTAPKPWQATPEKLALDRETRRCIDAAIERLSPRQRAVIVMRDIDGWDPADVCQALGITAVNQRVTLHRARNKVRAMLDAMHEVQEHTVVPVHGGLVAG